MLEARDGAWWDAGKVGLGPPPLKTAEGWLVMYHGAHQTATGPIYRVGLALLDLDDPRLVHRRTDEWIMSPTEPYERMGDVPGSSFPPVGSTTRRPMSCACTTAPPTRLSASRPLASRTSSRTCAPVRHPIGAVTPTSPDRDA